MQASCAHCISARGDLLCHLCRRSSQSGRIGTVASNQSAHLSGTDHTQASGLSYASECTRCCRVARHAPHFGDIQVAGIGKRHLLKLVPRSYPLATCHATCFHTSLISWFVCTDTCPLHVPYCMLASVLPRCKWIWPRRAINQS